MKCFSSHSDSGDDWNKKVNRAIYWTWKICPAIRPLQITNNTAGLCLPGGCCGWGTRWRCPEWVWCWQSSSPAWWCCPRWVRRTWRSSSPLTAAGGESENVPRKLNSEYISPPYRTIFAHVIELLVLKVKKIKKKLQQIESFPSDDLTEFYSTYTESIS